MTTKKKILYTLILLAIFVFAAIGESLVELLLGI